MKTLKQQTLAAFALAAMTWQSWAIQNVQLSTQGSNVVVAWPSQAGASYIVQHRQTLDTNESWATLTNALPAATGTNWTQFVHYDQLHFPVSTNGGGGGITNLPLPLAAVAGAGKTYPLFPPMPPFEEAMNRAQELRQRLLTEGRAAFLNRLSTEKQMTTALESMTESVTNTGFYRVVQTGMHFFGLTNGSVIKGRLTLPIEYAFDNGLSMESVFATLGTNATQTEPVPGLEISGLGTGFLQATWDTTQGTNGTYVITLSAQFSDESITNIAPITLIVRNEVFFPDSFNVAGWFINVQAQTIYSNGNYHVAMYDDTGWQFVDHSGTNDAQGYITYDGARGFLIPNYNPETYEIYPSLFYQIVVTASPAGAIIPAGLPSVNTNFVWTETSWPASTYENLNTAFSIGYQTIFGDPRSGSPSAVALESMIQLWYVAAQERDGGDSEGGLGVTRGSDQNPFELVAQESFSTMLMDWRQDEVRNVYYFGHGSPDLVGQRNVTPKKFLDATDIAQALNNGSARNTNTAVHPFRFVFLDGCNTAKGNLCTAFGIPKEKNMAQSRFMTRGVRFRAFAGWDTSILGYWFGEVNQAHLNFMGRFVVAWNGSHGNPPVPNSLRYALDAAKPGYDTANDGHLIIYGYEGLLFDDTIP